MIGPLLGLGCLALGLGGIDDEPKAVEPVVSRGVLYVLESQDAPGEAPVGLCRVWLKALEPATLAMLWEVKVYEFDGRRATSSPAALGLLGGSLLIRTRDNQHHAVDLAARTAGRVEDERWMIGDRCKLHPAALEEDVVPIRFGLSSEPANFPGGSAKFPTAWSWVDGGCVVGTARRALVRYCPTCRAAQAEAARAKGVPVVPDEDLPIPRPPRAAKRAG